jgi:hypothetical protein
MQHIALRVNGNSVVSLALRMRDLDPDHTTRISDLLAMRCHSLYTCAKGGSYVLVGFESFNLRYTS